MIFQVSCGVTFLATKDYIKDLIWAGSSQNSGGFTANEDIKKT